MSTTMERDEFISLANAIASLEEDKKDINEDIKTRINDAAEHHGIDKKVIKAAVKEYIKYEKDRAQYIVEDREKDQLLLKVINPSNE